MTKLTTIAVSIFKKKITLAIICIFVLCASFYSGGLFALSYFSKMDNYVKYLVSERKYHAASILTNYQAMETIDQGGVLSKFVCEFTKAVLDEYRETFEREDLERIL